jgi:hypothetical protein
MAFSVGKEKEKLLKAILLHEETRSQETFQSSYLSLPEMNVPIHNPHISPQMALQQGLMKTFTSLGLAKKASLSQTYLLTRVSFIRQLYVLYKSDRFLRCDEPLQ